MATLRKPDIFFRANGQIDIPSHLSHMLNLQPEDCIDIYFQRESRELYLYVPYRASEHPDSVASHRNRVRVTNSKSRYYRVSSKELVNKITLLSGGPEAWLFVGAPKSVQISSNHIVAVPILWQNNQYKPL